MIQSTVPFLVNVPNSQVSKEWYFFLQSLVSNPIKAGKLPTPTTALQGTRGFVTDATATTFYSIVAGGGSNFVPVFCDGSHWRIG